MFSFVVPHDAVWGFVPSQETSMKMVLKTQAKGISLSRSLIFHWRGVALHEGVKMP